MFKRLLVCLVLSSMMLHCAGRLGCLDNIYKQRHRIAYNLGLIAEIPIAICNGDYDFDVKPNFQPDSNHESGTPFSYQSKEITLFFLGVGVKVNPKFKALNCSINTQYSVIPYKSPDQVIFQPPKI